MQTQAYFDNIQQQLIIELEKSQQSIYIAVAWFTDDKLIDPPFTNYYLCEKG
jgi:hypothetical protein